MQVTSARMTQIPFAIAVRGFHGRVQLPMQTGDDTSMKTTAALYATILAELREADESCRSYVTL